jgi:hypothetical protein
MEVARNRTRVLSNLSKALLRSVGRVHVRSESQGSSNFEVRREERAVHYICIGSG